MITTTTDYEAMRAALDADPEDWDLRLVLADLCEETGRENEAACLRWQARERKRARKGVVNSAYEWWDEGATNGVTDVESDLPTALFLGMRYASSFTSMTAYFKTRREAEMALVDAFAKWEGKPE